MDPPELLSAALAFAAQAGFAADIAPAGGASRALWGDARLWQALVRAARPSSTRPTTALASAAAAPTGLQRLVWLADVAGADVRAADNNGWTALHWTAECAASAPAVVALLRRGASPTAATADGRTPLRLALDRKHDIIALALLEHAGETAAVGAGDAPALSAAHALGVRLKNAERWLDAECVLRHALTGRRSVLGPNHVGTLESSHCLAYVLDELPERGAEAEALYRDTLARRTHVLGPDDTDTLTSKHDLAHVLFNRGAHADAAMLNREVLEARKRALGADDEDTLLTMQNYACALDHLRMLDESIAQHRAALAGRTRVLGADHADTLCSRHNLGVALHKKGALGGAEAELRAVVAARGRVLGEKHALTVDTKAELAAVLAARGSAVEAEALLRAVVAARSHALGAWHARTRAAEKALARLLKESAGRARR